MSLKPDNSINYERLKEVWSEAVAKSSQLEQQAYLDRACAGQAELRREVEFLLRAHALSKEFLEEPAGPPVEAAIGLGPGDAIGPYRLLRILGEGGIGRVFLAEQSSPIKRQVALKIIKAGMDTREVVARFEAERQALALMEHPNIARVLDAGATEAGRPYFVMDLIQGLPITDFCDQHSFNAVERLRLFAKICQAVHHAHHRGIIHRDLKPTNILVAWVDGEPEPKVIDFGVAKALGQKLTDRTLLTGPGLFLGTPVYMSPEQATAKAREVDARSDIYALGVLLYELLTGTPPLAPDTTRRAAIEEIWRLVRETEPSPPSTRLKELGDTLAEVARRRRTEPLALGRLLRDDLDWVVMKALEKDPARRYETAHDLLQEIRRYLEGAPVRARPPSPFYRARKFIRRHRFVLGGLSVVALALLGGWCFSTWHVLREQARRERAEVARNHRWRIHPSVARFEQTGARVFTCVYHWEVAEALPKDYKCLVHLYRDGVAWVNQDHWLAPPTSEWRVGQNQTDGAYQSGFEPELSDGDYDWFIGLFDYTGEGGRLFLTGACDKYWRVRLGTLRVAGSSVTFIEEPRNKFEGFAPSSGK